MKIWRFRMKKLHPDLDVWIGGWIAPGEELEVTVNGHVVALVDLDSLIRTVQEFDEQIKEES